MHKTPPISTAWRPLREGDTVDLIAPASGISLEAIEGVKQGFRQWGLIPRCAENVCGDDLLCANTDEARFSQLQDALFNDISSAVWCFRGGYGSTRLLPSLAKLAPPPRTKLFLGFSDITALHIFLQQQWQWQTVHSPSARQVGLGLLPEDNLSQVRRYLFGEDPHFILPDLIPLNAAARQTHTINTCIVGGNLTLVATSLGTSWQLQTRGKTLFLEEVHERPFRVDRLLTQLEQAHLFDAVDAVILGDILTNKKEDEPILARVIQRFAENCSFPVLKTTRIGHSDQNYPLPLNSPVQLDLRKQHITWNTICA